MEFSIECRYLTYRFLSRGQVPGRCFEKLQVLPAGGYPRVPFSRQSLSNPPSPPSPLFIRWGLKPLPKPLAILARGLQPLLLVALSLRYAWASEPWLFFYCDYA